VQPLPQVIRERGGTCAVSPARQWRSSPRPAVSREAVPPTTGRRLRGRATDPAAPGPCTPRFARRQRADLRQGEGVRSAVRGGSVLQGDAEQMGHDVTASGGLPRSCTDRIAGGSTTPDPLHGSPAQNRPPRGQSARLHLRTPPRLSPTTIATDPERDTVAMRGRV
jgi:hypothetical protein